MSGSRNSLKKKSLIFNPRATNNWSKDESKFGQRMLEKMGWKMGQGIGRNNQGISENIKIRLKVDCKGLGFKVRDDQHVEIEHTFSELLSNLSQSSVDQNSDGNSSLEYESQISSSLNEILIENDIVQDCNVRLENVDENLNKIEEQYICKKKKKKRNKNNCELINEEEKCENFQNNENVNNLENFDVTKRKKRKKIKMISECDELNIVTEENYKSKEKDIILSESEKNQCENLNTNEVKCTIEEIKYIEQKSNIEVRRLTKAEKIIQRVRLLKSLQNKHITHSFKGSNLDEIKGYGNNKQGS